MPVGFSDGTSYKNEEEWLATTGSTMALGGSTEPAGALKQTGGTQTPGNSDKVNNDVIATIPVAQRLGLKGADITTEDVDTAINVGLSAGPGTMAGVKSATIGAKLSDLGHAQVLEAAGEHPDTIWSKTGFGRGAEGRWRYEINDSAANFNPTWYEGAPTEKWSIDRYQNPNAGTFTEGTKVDKLSAILDHPELYKAYPHLKDVLVKMDPAYAKEGAFWNNSNTITMGSEAAKNQGTLMHEVQHAIQDFEGFAKGGAPRSDAGYLKYTPDMKALEPEMREIIRKSDTPGYTFTAKDIERKNYLTQVAQKYREYTEAAYNQAHEFYERLAGETESRNVDTRLLLTEAERRRMPPTWTEDLPRSKQIPRDRPTSTTAYGIVEGGKYVKPASEPANLDTGVIPDPGNYGRALVNQKIQALEKEGAKIQTKDYNSWQKIAVEEDHKIGNYPNGYKAAKNYSKDGKYTMLLDPDGKRYVYYNGRRLFQDMFRDMPK